ncbi:stimulated by retinoic acid gene 6 protein-like [Acanthaster planci]|uniref:Stimulated by retinoic acid gene 6 protein-like n=1 Tax=Acanthaster planci TaxID=133434 RepID=A0A8B7YW77_ACAPL|nr:stimulated by retinoic acid gene 6 protein-like [Acanthaster planci]
MSSAANKTCIIAEYRGSLVHGSFPFAVCIILVLSYIQRTKKERRPGDSRNPLRDVFSLLYPIDLFDNHDRLPHCLAFGAASSLCLDLLFGDYQSYFFAWVMPAWAKILIGTIVTIEIAVDCFPFFACITCKSRLLANGIGFLYLSGWFVLLILISIGCENREAKGQVPVLVPQIPVLICLFLLVFYFLGMFIFILIQRRRGITPTSQERLYKTHQAIYVRNLLNKPREVVYTGWRAKLAKYYKPHPGFIYPTRVLMPCFVSIIALYQIAFWLIPLGLNLIDAAYGLAVKLAQQNFPNPNATIYNETLEDIMNKLDQAHTGLTVCWWIAGVMSVCVVPLLYIPHILKNYRKHLLSMWSGQYNLPTSVTLTSTDSIVGSMKYIGFQVAVFIAGCMFVQGFLTFLLIALTFFGLFSSWFFEEFFVNSVVEIIIPSIIVGTLVMSSQGIVVKKFFTQDKLKPDDADKPLSLQHRAWFLLYSYVTLFLNLLYGLIFAVLRIVIGVIISVILLPRIDRPIWAPGVGDKDLVYVLYAGNLYTENAHSNPILVMFCHLMVFDILNPKRKQLRMSQLHRQMSDKGLINSQAPSYTDLESTSTETERPHLLRFFRWHLAYTLINNPSVIRLRKSTAVLPDQEVMISEGEARFVNAGKGNRGHQMLPHMMEVMKRQNSGLRDMSEVAPTVTRPSVNAVDPELIVIEDLPAIPQSPGNSSLLVSPLLPIEDSQLQSGPTSEPGNPAKPARGEKGLHTADSESTA